MTDRLTLQAYAKVNLFLRVLAREDDGYHSIETLFCRTDLADELSAERREGTGVTLTLEGTADNLGPVEENLVVRAAKMVLDATGNHTALHFSVTKRIPAGAGLGGGSSDAAAALHLAGILTGNAVPGHELFQFASRLGADVPFLFSESCLSLGWGHGERLISLPPLPVAPALIVSPAVTIPTKDAYAWVDAARSAVGRRGSVALDLEALSSWGSIGKMAGNDFESVVFGRYPEVRASFEALAATRPLLCRMSGSGSSLFAIYRSERDREDAKMMLGRKHGGVWSVSLGARG